MKRILMTLSLLTLLVLGFLLGSRFFPDSILGSLWSSRQSAVITQVELEKLSLLNTAEYRMRLIFPYDFVDSETDWVMYKNMWEFHRSLFYSKSDPSEYVGGVLPQEWAAAAFYAQCRDAGIDPFLFRYDFLVLPVRVKAGLDLSSLENHFGELPLMVPYLDEQGHSILQLNLPPADITSVEVEDLDSREWGYPDAPISPEELRVLIDLLQPAIDKRIRESGILEEADRQARLLLESLFSGSGYSRIEYNS